MKPATTMAVHFSSATDDWATPQHVYDELNAKYGPFNLDVCATTANTKCSAYFNKEIDGLSRYWVGTRGLEPTRCWMNPPYGRTIGQWVKKAYEESQKGCLVVCLLPARIGSRWMREYIKQPLVTSKVLTGGVDPVLGEWIKGDTVTVYELPGRLKFGNAKHSAPFPSMVVVFYPPGGEKV